MCTIDNEQIKKNIFFHVTINLRIKAFSNTGRRKFVQKRIEFYNKCQLTLTSAMFLYCNVECSVYIECFKILFLCRQLCAQLVFVIFYNLCLY